VVRFTLLTPKRDSILGIKAYPNLAAIDDEVDLAVVVIPAPYVPAVIEECVEKGVRGAIIISAGFKERGPKGVGTRATNHGNCTTWQYADCWSKLPRSDESCHRFKRHLCWSNGIKR
jgi:hypothetical protein